MHYAAVAVRKAREEHPTGDKEKIRVVLDGLRGESSIAELCRREGIAEGLYTTIHGLALLAARRFAEALPHLRASVAADAEFAGHYNALISCCGHLNLLEEAAEFITRRNKVGPPLRVSVLRHNLRDFAQCDVFAEGLIKAGVPE